MFNSFTRKSLEFAEGGYSKTGQPFKERMQHLYRGLSIIERSVSRSHLGVKEDRQSSELAIEDLITS